MESGRSGFFTFNGWELTLRKEEKIYKPFTYSVVGNKANGSSISRRYTSMESAFLHILNEFNENANIKNKYQSINDFMRSK